MNDIITNHFSFMELTSKQWTHFWETDFRTLAFFLFSFSRETSPLLVGLSLNLYLLGKNFPSFPLARVTACLCRDSCMYFLRPLLHPLMSA